MASSSLDLYLRRRGPPAPPWQHIELRDIVGKSPAELGHRRLVCAWRGFWLIRQGWPPLKVVHTDPRKERKF